MIVKNEAEFLLRCLKSIQKAADQIVIVDTGSTDHTVRIARDFGCTVIEDVWKDDFSYSRNLSIKHATCAWILWLDADDIVAPESLEPLNALKQRPPDRVYAFTIKNQKPGNTGSIFMQARMFPNHGDIFFERRIHEQIMLSALRLGAHMEHVKNVVIEHHGYATPAIMKKKAQRNVTLLIDDYSTDSPDAVTAIEIADSYTILENFTEASRWYRQVLEVPLVNKEFPVMASHAHLGLGNNANRAGSFEEGIRCFKNALALCPDRPDVMYSLAVSYDLAGQPDEAIETLKTILDCEEKALAIGVDYRQSKIKAYLRLDRILREQGLVEAEIAAAEKALRIAPDRPEIHNAIGALLFRQQQFKEALHSFDKSLSITQIGNIDGYAGLCLVMLKAGKIEPAQTTMETMEKLFTPMPRLWALLSIVRGNQILQKCPPDITQETLSQEKETLLSFFGIDKSLIPLIK